MLRHALLGLVLLAAPAAASFAVAEDVVAGLDLTPVMQLAAIRPPVPDAEIPLVTQWATGEAPDAGVLATQEAAPSSLPEVAEEPVAAPQARGHSDFVATPTGAFWPSAAPSEVHHPGHASSRSTPLHAAAPTYVSSFDLFQAVQEASYPATYPVAAPVQEAAAAHAPRQVQGLTLEDHLPDCSTCGPPPTKVPHQHGVAITAFLLLSAIVAVLWVTVGLPGPAPKADCTCKVPGMASEVADCVVHVVNQARGNI